jgi:hypothetical protein
VGPTDLAPPEPSSSSVVHVSLTFCPVCTSLSLYLDERFSILVSEAVPNVANLDSLFTYKYCPILACAERGTWNVEHPAHGKKGNAAFGKVKVMDVAKNSDTHRRSECLQQWHRAPSPPPSPLRRFPFRDLHLCKIPQESEFSRRRASCTYRRVTYPVKNFQRVLRFI